MKKPPPVIDNARVVWRAHAGNKPFGLCGDVEVYGFAICRYESGALYRFSCDSDWQTVNDWDHDDVQAAMRQLPQNHRAAVDRIHWKKYTA